MNGVKMKKLLTDMNACTEAIEWVGDRDLQKAWEECERADWMLWLAGRSGINLRTLTLVKARCAKLVIHLMEDERSRKAVEVAEKFGLGQATREELNEARGNAASAYAVAAAYDDAADAAYADAAYAAYAAATYADAVAASAYADAAVAYAAVAYVVDAAIAAYAVDAYAAVAYAVDATVAAVAADVYAAARRKVLKQCAEICREVIPFEAIESAVNKTEE